MKKAGIAAIMVFYIFIVFFGIVLLSAVQLRLSGGDTYDTWRLNYDANRGVNGDLLTSLDNVREKARSDANSLRGNQGCLRLFSQDGLPDMKLVDPLTAEQILEARKNRTPIEQLVGDVNCIVKGISWVQNDIDYYKGLVDEHNVQLTDLKESLADNVAQYADLVKEHQDFLAFKKMEDVWYQRPLVVIPYDMLVLLLVIFMGALGGVVRLLRDYGAADHSNPAEAEYFFIPLIGAVVAIGGYVLAKTGLLLLSSGRADSSLSPFVISLVGIISGLLAKEVIDTIASRGRKMLAAQDRAD